ncbi:hypothetical protein B0I18_1075 [Taibaiella chishuiensis]|uniref:Uncharacterized protein n=1 Tax=Taibaiella chishuiensis TaxID=1434707 RepID=A0A2P8D040_9BACT|nr:hypothetical protein B0I18_1075 [Taibaiella chishuiensis]
MGFYNYVIGRLYSWAVKKKNGTPIANVVFTMCIVHYFQMFTIYMILRKIFNFPDFILGVNRLYVGLLIVGFFVVYYLLFFNKNKWEFYAKQVEQEELRKGKTGNFLVLLYLIGSILLFFISLSFVFA